MTRKTLIDWLASKAPMSRSVKYWIFLTLSAIFLLPLGLPFFYSLTYIGVEDAPRLIQLLMLVSVPYGFVIGVGILSLIDFTDFSRLAIFRVKWLARIAVVSPILILLTLFLFFSRP
jgi:hypothetical protein